MVSDTYVKIPRAELVSALVLRDGTKCQHPEHNHELNFDASTGPQEVTLDHWYPQYQAKADGWTMAEIWSLDNLKLMCKRGNASKGDRIPNKDGSLPEKQVSNFRFRRQKRANRPEACDQCDNGHNLLIGERCAGCGCDAQRFPRWAKVRAPDCSHADTWCWACSIGIVERTGALEMIMLRGEGGEDA